jgi:hypothetical protein
MHKTLLQEREHTRHGKQKSQRPPNRGKPTRFLRVVRADGDARMPMPLCILVPGGSPSRPQSSVRSRARARRLPDGSLYSLMNLLEGSGATMFYSFAVEYGCWWLPALRRGQKCFGSPALRPSEFMCLLNEMIRELREVPMTPERLPRSTFREELCPISPTGNAKERLMIVKRPV